jgi:hypothetical protein
MSLIGLRHAAVFPAVLAMVSLGGCAPGPDDGDGLGEGSGAVAGGSTESTVPPVLAMLRAANVAVFEGEGLLVEVSPITTTACRASVAARGLSGDAYRAAMDLCAAQGVLAKLCEVTCSGVEEVVLLPNASDVALGEFVFTNSGKTLNVSAANGQKVTQSLAQRALTAWNGTFDVAGGTVTLSAAGKSGVTVTSDGKSSKGSWATLAVNGAQVPAVGTTLTLSDGTTVKLDALDSEGKRKLSVLGAAR